MVRRGNDVVLSTGQKIGVDSEFCRKLFARGDKRALTHAYTQIITKQNQAGKTAVSRDEMG